MILVVMITSSGDDDGDDFDNWLLIQKQRVAPFDWSEALGNGRKTVPGTNESNFQKSKRQIVKKKLDKGSDLKPMKDGNINLGHHQSGHWDENQHRQELSSLWRNCPSDIFGSTGWFKGKMRSLKSLITRPGCKPPRAYQGEWSPIRNWLKSRFWYCESSFSFYPQKIRL